MSIFGSILILKLFFHTCLVFTKYMCYISSQWQRCVKVIGLQVKNTLKVLKSIIIIDYSFAQMYPLTLKLVLTEVIVSSV